MKYLFLSCAFILVASTAWGVPDGRTDSDALPGPRLAVLEAQAENGDSEARMELIKLLLAGSGSDRNVERASYWLRRVVLDLEDMDDIFEAMEVLGELHKEVLLEYPDCVPSSKLGRLECLG